MNPSGSPQQVWIVALLIALVILRYLARELRPRRINPASTWWVPAIILVLGIWMAITAYKADASVVAQLAIGCVVAIPIGLGLGFAVSLFTRVIKVVDGTAIVLGSWTTVAIWLVTFGVRFLGRLAISAASLGEQFMLNAVFLVMLAAALAMVRVRVLAMAREMPPSAPAPATSPGRP